MGNQHVKPLGSPRRSHSAEAIPGTENSEHEFCWVQNDDGAPEISHAVKKKRRSKDDMELSRLDTSEEEPLREIVIKMPKKKKDMERMITTQAIEIRGKDEIIAEGKTYVMRLMEENDKCVRRLEERDKLVEEKEKIITAIAAKLESLKELLEGKVREVSEKDAGIRKANEENEKLQKHLEKQECILKEMQGALERLGERKENGEEREGHYEKRFEINSLKRELGRVKSELEDRETMISNGRKYLDKLHSDKDNLQKDLRDRERECNEKQFVIERMTREKERDKIQIRQKGMEADAKGKALEQTESELRTIKGQIRERDHVIAEKERALARLERLKAEVDRQLDEERRTNTTSLARLREEIARLREEKRGTDERLRRTEAESGSLVRTVQSLEAERNREKQSADFLRKDQPWMITKSDIILSEFVLGTGAWGRVLEGEFRGMKVAVKEIHEVIKSPHNKKMFDQEISFATLVRHPCILQFLGVADYRTNNPLLVTELMDMSLSDLLAKENSLSRRYVVTLALDIAFGLNYLHCFKPYSIIHRDLNPGNVMVWRQGDIWRAKLCDFGSAEFVSSRMSVNPGNPFYSAPEVDTPKQTPKIDVYSYGVLLCELCISKAPVPKERKRQIGLVWNPDLRNHIEQCVRDDPEERPTMALIIEVLKSLGSS